MYDNCTYINSYQELLLYQKNSHDFLCYHNIYVNDTTFAARLSHTTCNKRTFVPRLLYRQMRKLYQILILCLTLVYLHCFMKAPLHVNIRVFQNRWIRIIMQSDRLMFTRELLLKKISYSEVKDETTILRHVFLNRMQCYLVNGTHFPSNGVISSANVEMEDKFNIQSLLQLDLKLENVKKVNCDKRAELFKQNHIFYNLTEQQFISSKMCSARLSTEQVIVNRSQQVYPIDDNIRCFHNILHYFPSTQHVNQPIDIVAKLYSLYFTAATAIVTHLYCLLYLWRSCRRRLYVGNVTCGRLCSKVWKVLRHLSRAVIWTTVFLQIAAATTAYELEPTTRVYRVGVSGSSVTLPCQLPALPAPPALVLWYRGTATKPFYSFDGRGNEGSGSHKIHDASPLGRRTSFTPSYRTQPYQGVVGELEVRNLTREDTGNYTCRVDFLHFQTVMALLTLSVHEPVERLEIVDIFENEVQDVAGPYEEQSSLYLKCRATGGYPQPDLEWVALEANQQAPLGTPSSTSSSSLSSFTSSSYTSAYPGTGRVEAVLQVAELGRGDQGRIFTCRANNSRLIDPRFQTVTLDMYYGPLAVELIGLDAPLIAGMHREVECRTGGSRPPPTVIWTPEHLFEALGVPLVTDSGNLSVSRARLVPGWEDDGRSVSCTATNPTVPRYSLAAMRTLIVKYPPRVEARLAPSLDPNNIKEGDDAFFECHIMANPDPRTIVWLHEDKEVVEGSGPGGRLFLHGRNLVFQSVLRAATGDYRCRVTNNLGSATSQPANLRVLYTPECKESTNVTVSVSPDEDVTLKCQVDSSSEKVKFRWAVNTTKGLIDFDPSRYNTESSSSFLTYKPYSYQIQEHDRSQDKKDKNNGEAADDEAEIPSVTESFGEVFCWAQNKIGWQKDPCAFAVRPAGPPGELVSCTLVNQSATSLAVSCVPGHNGGLQQSFSVRVLDELTGTQVANISSNTAQIVVTNLGPGRDYLVEVRAVNAKGTTTPVILQGFALKVAENKIHAITPNPSGSLLLPVFAGVVAGLLLVAVLLILTTKARHRNRIDRSQLQKPGDHAPLSSSASPDEEEDPFARQYCSNRQTFGSRPGTPRSPQSVSSSVLRSYLPIGTAQSSPARGLGRPDSHASRPPCLDICHTFETKRSEHMDTDTRASSKHSDGKKPCQTSTVDPLGIEQNVTEAQRSRVAEEQRSPTSAGDSSSTLPRHGFRGQPLTALVDRISSPGSTATSHHYYTLNKINCTRRHNESFV